MISQRSLHSSWALIGCGRQPIASICVSLDMASHLQRSVRIINHAHAAHANGCWICNRGDEKLRLWRDETGRPCRLLDAEVSHRRLHSCPEPWWHDLFSTKLRYCSLWESFVFSFSAKELVIRCHSILRRSQRGPYIILGWNDCLEIGKGWSSETKRVFYE